MFFIDGVTLYLLLQCFFDTVLEFTKLEKIEIGGLKGRFLSSRVVAVFSEFTEHLTVFGSKTYDALEPGDPAFELDYSDFQRKIRELDRRLASILCQAFDDCCNLESVFKVRLCVYSCLFVKM
jgi:dynein heavy chain